MAGLPVDWKRWLVAIGGTVALTAIVIAGSKIGNSGPSTDPRVPYAEAACEDFARRGLEVFDVDDIEVSHITANVYTVQLYTNGIRVQTCVVEATGPEEWTLVKLDP